LKDFFDADHADGGTVPVDFQHPKQFLQMITRIDEAAKRSSTGTYTAEEYELIDSINRYIDIFNFFNLPDASRKRNQLATCKNNAEIVGTWKTAADIQFQEGLIDHPTYENILGICKFALEQLATLEDLARSEDVPETTELAYTDAMLIRSFDGVYPNYPDYSNPEKLNSMKNIAGTIGLMVW
jgi:hypothetical protein